MNFFRELLFRRLRAMRSGCLVVEDVDGSCCSFGKESSCSVHLKVNDARFFRRVYLGGSLALGESYVDGWWDPGEDALVNLFQLLFKNDMSGQVRGSLSTRLIAAIHERLDSPRSPYVARKDIHAHYDLGNDFFKLMLDDSMSYSCGYQLHPEDSLDAMQRQKYERIAQKLDFRTAHSVLDIGCGFGAMLQYIGKNFPHMSGIGVTLSDEQFALANQRLREAKLDERFRVELRDYREVSGKFDRIVSIGMFEHVGLESYAKFFTKLHELLSPLGRGLLHTIGLEEPPERRQDPWMERYVFPGTYIPRLEQIAHGMRAAQLAVGHIENWRPHYARTLYYWRQNFLHHWPAITTLDPKFNKHFFRLWNYYLQLCESCFIDSTLELYQVLFCARDSWQFPRNFSF